MRWSESSNHCLLTLIQNLQSQIIELTCFFKRPMKIIKLQKTKTTPKPKILPPQAQEIVISGQLFKGLLNVQTYGPLKL